MHYFYLINSRVISGLVYIITHKWCHNEPIYWGFDSIFWTFHLTIQTEKTVPPPLWDTICIKVNIVIRAFFEAYFARITFFSVGFKKITVNVFGENFFCDQVFNGINDSRPGIHGRFCIIVVRKIGCNFSPKAIGNFQFIGIWIVR